MGERQQQTHRERWLEQGNWRLLRSCWHSIRTNRSLKNTSTLSLLSVLKVSTMKNSTWSSLTKKSKKSCKMLARLCLPRYRKRNVQSEMGTRGIHIHRGNAGGSVTGRSPDHTFLSSKYWGYPGVPGLWFLLQQCQSPGPTGPLVVPRVHCSQDPAGVQGPLQDRGVGVQ